MGALASGLIATAGPAAADGGGCSDKAVFFKYALRACIDLDTRTDPPRGLVPYVHIYLEDGHSPCRVNIRIVGPGGLNELRQKDCPSGGVSDTTFDGAIQSLGSLRAGTYQTFASIERLSDHLKLNASSPAYNA